MKWCAALVAGWLVSCGQRRPETPDTGTYGPQPSLPATNFARALPDLSPARPWTNGGLSIVQTELSPATLLHSTSKTLSFFANMMETGLGGPAFASIETQQGPKIFKPGDTIDSGRMRESWFVVWWSGATNWTNWDSPWFLTLQHRPAKIQFDTNGLHFTFPNEAGYAALMPLYGYYKPLPLALQSHPFYSLKEKKKRVLTWEWFKALPADPLARARYWASALREFPVYCEDTFSVDRAHDSVTIRQSFRWISWDDDWKTDHLKLAPVSPVLAHAVREGFPAEFSKQPSDMEIFTPQGPYYGVEGVNSYDVTISLLRYVNETEVPQTNFANATTETRATLEKLREAARVQFASASKPASAQAAIWFARALPFLDGATRTQAGAGLEKFCREEILAPGRTGADSLEALWTYAHFSGDWNLVRKHWPDLKSLPSTPPPACWAGFASDNKSSPTAGAAPALAFARLAWRAGDVDAYNLGAQAFVRELAHLWLSEQGGKYFQDNQPWHSMEPLTGKLYLNRLRPGMEGWQIDGPDYPKEAKERLSASRWANFTSGDINRFLVQHLRHGAPGGAGTNQLHTAPEQLIAACLVALATNAPARLERLIPGGRATPFVAGPERFVSSPGQPLVQQLALDAASPNWPRVTWPAWSTPAGSNWNFGQVRDSMNVPTKAGSSALNWNSRVTTFR